MKHCQEVSKLDLQVLKIWLAHFLGMFHVWELRIVYNGMFEMFTMAVNGCSWFPIVKIGLMGTINHCFNNKSQTDPSPCYNNAWSLYSVTAQRINMTNRKLILRYMSKWHFIIDCNYIVNNYQTLIHQSVLIKWNSLFHTRKYRYQLQSKT